MRDPEGRSHGWLYAAVEEPSVPTYEAVLVSLLQIPGHCQNASWHRQHPCFVEPSFHISAPFSSLASRGNSLTKKTGPSYTSQISPEEARCLPAPQPNY